MREEAHLKCLSEVRGQERAKRAIEIAAAGRHHLLMVGSPGSGKSMLAARVPGILPPLSAPEALENLDYPLHSRGFLANAAFAHPTRSRPASPTSMAAIFGWRPRARKPARSAY